MAGGIGNDYYFVDDLGDVVLESSLGGNSDTIFININGYILPSHIENITIGESIADVTGNSANNILVGNSLNNTLNGGTGADTLVGGDGNDYYIVDNVGDVTTELNGVSSGTDSVLSNIGYYALGNHIEYLTLGTGAVTGAGNSLDNTLIGNSGPYNSLFGGAGDDWLDGSSQISGKNTLNGGTGSDTMIGSAQNDWFVIDHAGDSIVGGGGTDGIISELNGYTLQEGFNALALGNGATVGSGNSGNNSLTGNSLNNTLNGGDGADTLMGGIGIDYYHINSSDDVVIELAGYGTDTIEVSGITSYTLAANTERLVLGAGAVNGTGTSLNNTLTGNTANNSLFGAAGNDSLFGGDGADTLVGTNASVRNEIDTLTGGSGADLFILGNSSGIFYNDAYNSQTGTTDYALITDYNFGEGDSLQLKSGTYYFGAASGGYQNLFYDNTITTYQDEVIARFSGSAFATTSFSTSGLAGLNVTWV
jgi:Ca2+-binding RTX toxin-like protein